MQKNAKTNYMIYKDAKNIIDYIWINTLKYGSFKPFRRNPI